MEVGSYLPLEKQVGQSSNKTCQDSASTKKIIMFSIIYQLKQLDLQSAQRVESVKTVYVMKSRPLKDDPVNSLHKSKAVDGQQREDIFHEVRPRS